MVVKDGFGYCFLSMLMFVLMTILLTANFSAFAVSKSSFRRSLLLSIDERTVDQQAEHITVLDLGASAEGVFHPDEVVEMEVGEQHNNRARRDAVYNQEKTGELNVGYILCHGNITNFDTIERHFTTSVKSILVFTNRIVNFRIVTDSVLDIREMVERTIPEQYWDRFDIRGDETQEEMASLKESLKFKGCGHLKMTFHHTFNDIDSLLLLDADTLLLNPIEELFAEMDNFTPSQVLAMATEHPWNENGYYTHRPYAHNPAGLNGGLLFYNFTRLAEHSFATPNDANRTHTFEEALTSSVMHHLIPRQHFLADQCAANAIFHHNPEKMYLLPCKWNLRSWGLDTCTAETCYCESALKQNGCGLLHGQGRSFVPFKKNVGFSTVWQSVLNYPWREFNADARVDLKKTIQANLEAINEIDAENDRSGLTLLKQCM